jgi:hypothetical protein
MQGATDQNGLPTCIQSAAPGRFCGAARPHTLSCAARIFLVTPDFISVVAACVHTAAAPDPASCLLLCCRCFRSSATASPDVKADDTAEVSRDSQRKIMFRTCTQQHAHVTGHP